MEKTINISGRDVRIKTNGLAPIIYRKEFGRDFFKDMASLQSIKENGEGMNIEYFLNLAWLYASIADKNIPDRDTWLESFEEFPVMDYVTDLIELTMQSITTKNTKNFQSKAKTKASH